MGTGTSSWGRRASTTDTPTKVAYSFYGTASGPSETAGWTKEPDLPGALFGLSIECAGSLIAVGAPALTAGHTQEGRVYIYQAGFSGPTFLTSREADLIFASFGISLTWANVNGDTFPDLIVGAPDVTNGETGEGRIYVYHSMGANFLAPYTFESNFPNARFGASLGASHVNGDAYRDVIVGAPDFAGPSAGEGKVYVYNGSSGGLTGTPWTKEGDVVSAFSGRR